MIRTIQRAALDRSLKTARALPDRAAKMLGRQDAELALDRAEAEVRDVAGRVLFDPELRQDATKRRLAADEREKALRLRAQAAAVTEEADEELAEREERAQQRRQEAAQKATQRKQQAAKRTQQAKAQVAKTAQAREEAAAKAEQRKQEQIDSQARKERLEALDTKAKALDEQAEAATARDEALRLKRAAAETKAKRKQAQEA
jgi:colicin import membrane protein